MVSRPAAFIVAGALILTFSMLADWRRGQPDHGDSSTPDAGANAPRIWHLGPGASAGASRRSSEELSGGGSHYVG